MTRDIMSLTLPIWPGDQVNSLRRLTPVHFTPLGTQIAHADTSRFQTGREEPLAARHDHRDDPLTEEVRQGQRQRTVNRLMAHLDDREQTVISNRFGLNYRLEPKTLKEVGELLGVSRERARQSEARAISKLRDIKRLRVC